MKRVIRSSTTITAGYYISKIKDSLSPNYEKYFCMESTRNGRLSYSGYIGNLSHPERISIQMTKVAPYDDAEYAWAKVSGTNCTLIRSGKRYSTTSVRGWDPDAYEDVNEYLEAVCSQVADILDQENQDIKPRMMHN